MQYDEQRVTSAAENIIQACKYHNTNVVYVCSGGNTIFIQSPDKQLFRLLDEQPEFVHSTISKVFELFGEDAPVELDNSYIALPFKAEDLVNKLEGMSTAGLRSMRKDCCRTLYLFKRELADIDEVLNSRKKEPVPVQNLFPLLKEGYVAMNKDGMWYWFENPPILNDKGFWWSNNGGETYSLSCFYLLKADDYTKSKQQVD